MKVHGMMRTSNRSVIYYMYTRVAGQCAGLGRTLQKRLQDVHAQQQTRRRHGECGLQTIYAERGGKEAWPWAEIRAAAKE